MSDIWTYRTESDLGADPAAGVDMTGYKVEALDGSIGKVDEATYEVGSSYIVVDTGPWIFGKKVMLPAGVIERVDLHDESVFVNRTKDEIKDSPEFHDTMYSEPAYRDEIGTYYGPGGRGYRDWDTSR
ncbi:MAG: PRC-barrel domain containing protein [Acidimicrobiia bacterium]